MHWSKPTQIILNNCLKIVRHGFRQDCLLCGAGSGQELLCHACFDELPRNPAQHACPVCAAPEVSGVCGNCLQHPPAFERGIAALRYSFPVDQLIQAYKYHAQLPLAQLFGHCLSSAASSQARPDILLPMPLHPLRLRERGFNQALEIAKAVSRELQIPLTTQWAQRVVHTAAQATLDWEERKRNLRGAFVCADAVQGRHIAVIDDVMTSGATLHELSKTLRQAGAAAISVWVVARAAPRH